ncbi:MAG: hypothetical protein ACK55Z_11695, partial [bacterium]
MPQRYGPESPAQYAPLPPAPQPQPSPASRSAHSGQPHAPPTSQLTTQCCSVLIGRSLEAGQTAYEYSG